MVQKLFLAVMAAVMLTATAGAARAAETRLGLCDAPNACNYKTQILKPNPRDNWDYSQAIRTIYLAAGTYSMRYEGCTDHATSSAYLPEGNYSWRNLLDPKNGYYHQTVVLEGPVYWSRSSCDWQVRMKRRLALTVGAAATTLFTTFGAVSVAYAESQAARADPVGAAATCYGNTCSGKDPNATGCSAGAGVLADMVVLGASAKQYLVRLSYSPACNASWTDIQAINQPDRYGGESIWHEAVNNSTGAITRTASVYDGDACSAYTVMMSRVGRSTRACSTSTLTGRNVCTPWK